jgi:AbrB family looped-hinge helix DNA binding protein
MALLTSNVSPKGQVTLPADIRGQLGIDPKDRVSFEVIAEGIATAIGTFEPKRPSFVLPDDMMLSGLQSELPGTRSWTRTEPRHS